MSHYHYASREEIEALQATIGITWHCPGCGALIPDSVRVAARADFLCRCGIFRFSDFQIGLPDKTMSDEDVAAMREVPE